MNDGDDDDDGYVTHYIIFIVFVDIKVINDTHIHSFIH